MRLPKIWILSLFLCAGTARAQETEMQVELITPLGTETGHKGDAVSARVISPEALKGDIANGKITNLKTGNKLRGKAVLSFTFETLVHGDQNVPISSQIRSIANSKGQMNVDEDGHVLQNTNNLGEAAIGAGALISIVTIDMEAKGPSIRMAPGSRIALLAQSRSGPPLDSLSAHPASPPQRLH